MREAFSGSYGYDNELLGLGLTEIMKGLPDRDRTDIIVFDYGCHGILPEKTDGGIDGIFRTLGMRSMPCSGPGSENYLPDLRWHW